MTEGRRVNGGSSSVELGEFVEEPLETLLVPGRDDSEDDSDDEPKPNPSVKLEIKLPSPEPESLSAAVELKSSGALSVGVCDAEFVMVWFVHWRLIVLG